MLSTSDGTSYRVRPINTGDAQRERAFIMALSPESRFQRLMHTMREPSDAFISQPIDVDFHREMALVAVIGEPSNETFIGVARYAADEHMLDCEFAVVVADAWQCRGVGTALLKLLIQYAADHGFRSLYGNVLANNQRMIDLLEWLGFEVEARQETTTTVRVSRRLT
jgi:acetyltransferase